MGAVALTGNDTVIINDRIISDLADADAGTLDFPNDSATIKKGKNSSAIYAFNASGELCNVVLRVVIGSEDDKYFNALKTQQDKNFAQTVLMTGEFIKKVGDGKGKVKKVIYIMSGGIFTKGINAKSNVEGDSEQGVAVYNIAFANAPRSIS